MADKKISALTASSVPLAGTEVLPIVQSGATVKVAVSDLTAGRTVSMSGGTVTSGGAIRMYRGDNAIYTDLYNTTGASGGFVLNNANGDGFSFQDGAVTQVKINNGNVVISTSGKGIDFSATPGTGTSELLADYEEGTWTPSLTGGTSGSATSGGNTYGNYTKVGRLVTLNFVITISAVSTLTGNVKLSGLPFNLAAGAAFENRYPQGSTIFGSLNTSWSSIVIGSDGGTTTLAFTGIKTPATGTTNVVAADLTATSFFAGSIQYIA